MEFTDQPKPVVVLIVKEFYANAKETEGRAVQVRGKAVSYDKANINAYYHIPDIEGDNEFTEYMTEDIDLDEVIKALYRPWADLKAKEHEAISFSHKELNRYGKAWYYFIYAKLMPTTHVNDVIKDRVVLLYVIVTGKTVDMAQIIQDSITYAIKGSSTIGLPYPSLICGLCKKAKVKWSVDEVIQQPKSLIDQRTINRFQ